MGNLSSKTMVGASLCIAYVIYCVILLMFAPHAEALVAILLFGALQICLSMLILQDGSGKFGSFRLYPLLLLPMGCCCLQLLLGVYFAFALPDGLDAVAAVGIALLAASVICLLVTRSGLSYASKIEDEVADDSEFMRTLLLRLGCLKASPSLGADEKAPLDQLIEKARYSDVRSNPSVSEIEEEISGVMDDLESGEGDMEKLTGILLAGLERRDLILKESK
ncbi:MAG: hypothetical protein HFJ66_02455 [Eggerthellaceae bacterium]|nr:hypothetical protein [Eggerthellaceae bacterium]